MQTATCDMVPAGAVDGTIASQTPLLDAGDIIVDGGNSYYVDDIDRANKLTALGIHYVDVGTSGGVWGLDDRDTTADQGNLHCGQNGAGHFVKMVHNGIEYGMMAAYAEGLGILRAANIGKQTHAIDAETTPLRDPEHYQYDLNLPEISELGRRAMDDCEPQSTRRFRRQY